MNASRLSATRVGESIGRMNSQTAVRSGFSPPGSASRELAGDPLGAERLGARDAVGVEHERGGPAGGELRDSAERVGVVERSLQLGVEDRVGVTGFVASGVADGLLALAVAPAGAVGDHLAVVAGDQVADDRLERVQLAVGGVDELGVDVVAEAEVAALAVGLAGPLGLAALAVLGGGVAQLLILELGAGEVRLLARRRLVAVVLRAARGRGRA